MTKKIYVFRILIFKTTLTIKKKKYPLVYFRVKKTDEFTKQGSIWALETVKNNFFFTSRSLER